MIRQVVQSFNGHFAFVINRFVGGAGVATMLWGGIPLLLEGEVLDKRETFDGNGLSIVWYGGGR